MPTTSPERGCSSSSTLQHQRCTEDATGGTSPSNPSSASQRLRTTLNLCTCCYSARCRFELGFEVNAAPGPCAAFCSSPAHSGQTAASRSVHRRESEKNRHFFSDSDHLGVEHAAGGAKRSENSCRSMTRKQRRALFPCTGKSSGTHSGCMQTVQSVSHAMQPGSWPGVCCASTPFAPVHCHSCAMTE